MLRIHATTMQPRRGFPNRLETRPFRLEATGDSVSFSGAKTEFRRRLFPGGVKALHLYQSGLPNCQTLGTIFIMSRNPSGARILANMITPQANGDSFLVTFRQYPHLQIPVALEETRRKDANRAAGALGVRILEVAYARLIKTLHPEQFKDVPDNRILETYRNPHFPYDESVAMQAFTGWPSKNIEFCLDGNPSRRQKREILAQFQAFAENPERYLMTVYTKKPDARQQKLMEAGLKQYTDPGDKLLAYHVFGVERIDPTRRIIFVRDPQNTEVGLHFSYDTFFKNFRGWCLTEIPAGNPS